ncbi:MAG: type II toxin-antitoxin system HicA family toxin [Prochloron sp. SP5CPC1]|nr:type II toxin-antitoxin system HicA family toxin [Candidatus Paraprochloron terpiosi SP5CPC1]
MKFSELVRLLESNGFRIVKFIRVDYHGAKKVPTGTCHAILKAAGIKK